MNNRFNINIQFKDIGLSNEIIIKLKNNYIYNLDDLWKLSKDDLKRMNINNEEIKLISIKLQLLGLDLNKKIYK